MGKTDRTMWLMGDKVPIYICDQCEEETEGDSLYWEHKDFTLCANCLEASYKMIFETPKHRKPRTYIKKPIPKGLRNKVFDRDNHRCRYCGDTEFLTADHVIPESRGGPTTLDNLVTACTSCNSRKGARTPEEAGMTLKRV